MKRFIFAMCAMLLTIGTISNAQAQTPWGYIVDAPNRADGIHGWSIGSMWYDLFEDCEVEVSHGTISAADLANGAHFKIVVQQKELLGYTWPGMQPIWSDPWHVKTIEFLNTGTVHNYVVPLGDIIFDETPGDGKYRLDGIYSLAFKFYFVDGPYEVGEKLDEEFPGYYRDGVVGN